MSTLVLASDLQTPQKLRILYAKLRGRGRRDKHVLTLGILEN
jgi:hypothetical protein